MDRTRRPLVCPGDRGAIDPEYLAGPGGRGYLLWKSEQTPRRRAALWITPLTPGGLRLAGPTRPLLRVQEPWEAGIIENPSMIAYAGRWYLFFSGGSYAAAGYGTGYATCASHLGPCTRVSPLPLLAADQVLAGTGGATAFVDRVGRLRLAYAAWDTGHTGYPTTTACLRTPYGCEQRRLHVATLAPSTDPLAVPGSLVVTARR